MVLPAPSLPAKGIFRPIRSSGGQRACALRRDRQRLGGPDDRHEHIKNGARKVGLRHQRVLSPVANSARAARGVPLALPLHAKSSKWRAVGHAQCLDGSPPSGSESSSSDLEILERCSGSALAASLWRDHAGAPEHYALFPGDLARSDRVVADPGKSRRPVARTESGL